MLKLFGIDMKWIAMLAIATLIAIGVGTIYDLVNKNAANQALLETQKQTISLQNDTIDNLKKVVKISEEIIQQRDLQLQQYDDLFVGTDNLGSDEGNIAAESLRELLRRLPE